MERKNILKNAVAALILGIFAAMIAYAIVPSVLSGTTLKPVVTIVPNSLPVTYRGATVGGKWYNVGDTVSTSTGWRFDPAENVYIAEEVKPLELHLTKARCRSLTFNVGPDQGSVTVIAGNAEGFFDLKGDYNPNGMGFAVPQEESLSGIQLPHIQLIAGVLSFTIVATFSFLTLQKQIKNGEKATDRTREVWGDLVRAICCFTIVVLHNTCNPLYQTEAGSAKWWPILAVNALTAFAVPCFYMISGAFLLRKETSIKDAVSKRVPKVYIPLIIWSIFYILTSDEIGVGRFVKMLVLPQTPHLWFIYCIVGIYLLLPFLSKLYCLLNDAQKAYLIALLLIVPCGWHDLGSLLGYNVPSLHFAVFWPDLGLFFLGAVLWNQRERLKEVSKIILFAAFFAGWGINIALTNFTSTRDGALNTSFISCIGSAGNILMATAVICIALSYRAELENLPNRVISVITAIGSASMGIYFIHILLPICTSQIPYLNKVLFVSNGPLGIILTIMECFLLCLLIVCCGRKVKWLNTVF